MKTFWFTFNILALILLVVGLISLFSSIHKSKDAPRTSYETVQQSMQAAYDKLPRLLQALKSLPNGSNNVALGEEALQHSKVTGDNIKIIEGIIFHGKNIGKEKQK